MGRSSEDIRLREKIYVHGEEIVNRNPFDRIKAFNFDDCLEVEFDTKKNFKETYVILKNDQSYILFQDLEFKRPSRKIKLEISSSNISKIVLYFSKIDKDFSFKVKDTCNKWEEIVLVLDEDLIGIHDMYIKGKGLKINWFEFE